jgi:hypothetical protein
MAKKRMFLGMLALALTFGLVSCTTYHPVDITNTMAAQVTSMKFYTPKAGEEVKTLYVDRSGSLVRDLNGLEGGTWYRNHQYKIVSIEAVKKNTSYVIAALIKDQWRVEYVE